MSIFRTPSPRKFNRLHLAVTVPAVAAVAAIAGAAGALTAGAAAQPAAIARPASIVRPSGQDTIRFTPAATRQAAQLDAVLETAIAPHGTPVAGGDGSAKGSKKGSLTPRQEARKLLSRFGWSKRQYRYLNPLWSRESSWNVHAENLYSGAYGIPQAVPGAKMATAGRNWRTSARTQIIWGMRYIKSRYGSPENAWDHELATGWY